jgi:hypothetical protein
MIGRNLSPALSLPFEGGGSAVETPSPLKGEGWGGGGGVAAKILASVLALALLLSACGKKGGLEPPPGQPNEFPRTYPSE